MKNPCSSCLNLAAILLLLAAAPFIVLIGKDPDIFVNYVCAFSFAAASALCWGVSILVKAAALYIHLNGAAAQSGKEDE